MTYIDTTIKQDTSYEERISRGLVRNHCNIFFNANNPTMPQASHPADINNFGNITPLTVASGFEIVSTSANDTGAGTGAQTVTLVMLDSNFEQHIFDITLNGTTPVPVQYDPGSGLITSWIAFNPIGCDFDIFPHFPTTSKVATAGTGTTNEGVITLRLTGAGATHGRIDAGTSVFGNLIYTVPAGFRFELDRLYVILNESGNTEYAKMQVSTYDYTNSISTERTPFSANQNSFDYTYTYHVNYREKIVSRPRVIAQSSPNIDITGAAEGVLVKI
jgi:hypothetical protein